MTLILSNGSFSERAKFYSFILQRLFIPTVIENNTVPLLSDISITLMSKY